MLVTDLKTLIWLRIDDQKTDLELRLKKGLALEDGRRSKHHASD